MYQLQCHKPFSIKVFYHIILALLCHVFIAHPIFLLRIQPGQAIYTAVAAQLYPLGTYSDPAPENIRKNLAQFDAVAATAKSKYKADIIVFPEAVLWSFGLSTRQAMYAYAERISNISSSLCQDPGQPLQLRTLSCIARTHKIVVVANMVTSVPCNNVTTEDADSKVMSDHVESDRGGRSVAFNSATPTKHKRARQFPPTSCPPDGMYLYNTQVAFSEKGVLLQKYYKMHIFGTAPIIDQPVLGEPKTFTTAFGVTFGMVCMQGVCRNSLYHDMIIGFQLNRLAIEYKISSLSLKKKVRLYMHIY